MMQNAHDEPRPFIGIELGPIEGSDKVVVAKVRAVLLQVVLPGCRKGSAGVVLNRDVDEEKSSLSDFCSASSCNQYLSIRLLA